MLQTRKIGAKHYYEYLPELQHKCGDIWSDLPTYGLVGAAPRKGLVITPACDLANRKSETIIYLPIIPLRSYFATTGALPEIKERLSGLLQAGKFDPLIDWPSGRYRPPSPAEIGRARSSIAAHLESNRLGQKEIVALDRAMAGIEILSEMIHGQLEAPQSVHLQRFFGSDWTKIKGEIVTNAYRTDIHFLPKDEQEGGFTALESHSIVNFRYPVTAPVEVLDLAQQVSALTWEHSCLALSKTYPTASAFNAARPVKVLSVKSEFLSDILSRYCAVYSRLGSPDFTPQTVLRIGQEVDV